MEQSQLEMLAAAMAAGALLAVAASILLPLARRGRLGHDRLDLAAALHFLASGVGHANRLERGVAAGAGGHSDVLLALGDAETAVIALAYLWLRRDAGTPEEGGVLHEDLRRRQHELAGQVMAANVREELATERAAAADHRLARVFAATPIGMAMVDQRGLVTRANPALGRMLGRDIGPGPEIGRAHV